MSATPEQIFFQGLCLDDLDFLHDIRKNSLQKPPLRWVAWQVSGQTLGYLNPQRAQWVAEHLTGCIYKGTVLEWTPQEHDGAVTDLAQRNAQITRLLEMAHHCGRLSGWRNERFGFWDIDCITPRPDQEPYLTVERSGFRFLGMLSHAAHINGFTEDGRIWSGQRALDKAIDPGLWDNLAAGGIPAGEGPAQCAVRELMEEAGIRLTPKQQLQYAGWVRISECSADDWHDEILHTFNICLNGAQVPRNLDGEVSRFQCFARSDWMRHVRAGYCTTDSILTLMKARNSQS